MPPAANEFQALLEQARQGDRKAMGELLRQYEPQLRLYARVHLGPALRSHADSLDLVQSAQKSLMLALWSNKYDFSGPDKLLALAKTILQRKLARLAERTRREQPPTGQDLPGREADPANLAAFRDTLDRIRDELSGPEQDMLLLALQGYNRKEAAERLGYEPAVFRVYWTRMTRRLRNSGILDDWV
jgi:RNA polymerase sigma factor (sigma-70 family)